MHIKVDKGRCCGAGYCGLIAPQVFDQDRNNGTVILLQEIAPLDLRGALLRVMDACPTSAIRMIEQPSASIPAV
jgi:ferredoxin